MFADNDKISWIQAKRQWMLTYLGPVCLWIGTSIQGTQGILGIVLAFAVLSGWSFLVLRQIQVYRYPQRYWGSFLSWVIALILQAYLVLTGTWVAVRTSDLAARYLVPGVPQWLLLLLFLLVAAGLGTDTQKRGRFAQVTWVMLAGILLVMLLTAMVSCIRDGLVIENPWSWISVNARSVGNYTVYLLGAFSGFLFLPYCISNVKNAYQHAGSFFGVVWKLGILTAVIALLLQFGYGTTEAIESGDILLNLMAGVHIPGGFLRRLDLIVLSLLVFGLFFTEGTVFYYCRKVGERGKIRIGQKCCVLLCFLLGIWELEAPFLSEWYLNSLKYFFLPFAFVLPLCTEIVRRRSHGNANNTGKSNE